MDGPVPHGGSAPDPSDDLRGRISKSCGRAGGSADTGSGKGADGAHGDHADAEDGRV